MADMGPVRTTGLSECLLGRRLAKSHLLRCSNWEARPLCMEQQQYAALDAVASLRLYEVPLCQLHAANGKLSTEALLISI